MKFTLLALALCLAAQQAAVCQPAPSMPAWLASYPGVTAETKSFPSLTQSTYTAPVVPSVVREHYRGLFEAQSLPFMPGSDGIGTVIRGTAVECDLLITIRQQGASSIVQVSCSAKSGSATNWTTTSEVTVSQSRASGMRPRSSEDFKRAAADAAERHAKTVAELGIHPVYQDAEAPPLVWPPWLVHLSGTRLATQRGVDQSKNAYLKSTFKSSVPMKQIHDFYEELLNANDYRAYAGGVSTGQTISGVKQESNGYVEGENHPNGTPGPYTVIHVSFSRFILNEPITVEVKFTAYPFKAPKRAF